MTPGTVRVAFLLARNTSRKWANRFASLRRKKKGARGPTPRKSTRSGGVLVFFGIWMLLSATMLSVQLVERLDESAESGFGAALGMILAILVTSTFFSGVGSTELGQAGWTMEWLFTFPVPTRGLFLARIGEYALTNAFAWFMVGPLLVVALWKSGYGAWGLPLGLAGALYLNVVVASVRVVAETWLRKRFGLRQLKNVQAFCTVSSMLLFFGAFWLALSDSVPRAFIGLARAVPEGWLWFPLSLPVLITNSAAAAAGMVVFAAAFVWGATEIATRLVRDGLVTTTGGPYSGTRAAAAPAKPSRLKGMLGKEVHHLARDRNFMVQTLLVPLLIIGFQAIVNPRMFVSGGRGGPVLAFGVGAYVLMFGGFSVLAVERQSLWLLFTFPHSLARLLRQKIILWGSVAAVYAGAVLALAWRPDHAATWVAPVFAVGGVFLFAAVAGGLGVLATDPLEEHTQRRIRQEWMWFYMLLAAMYGNGVYAESIWFKCVLVVLTALLAYAIWQKVEARIPLLLDPTAVPKPRLTLSEGIVATLLFFQIQFLFTVAFARGTDLPMGAQVVMAYVLAGFLSVLIILWVLRRGRIRLGLGGGMAFPGAALGGISLGAVGALIGVVYLQAVEWIEPLRQLKDQAWDLTASQDPASRWALAGLVVVAAPLLEEFIFRGLVFRGLRKTARLGVAVVGSALIFAVVHPPLSFVPVFALGVLTALGFERTKSLWTPILTHATYNAAMVLFASNLLE